MKESNRSSLSFLAGLFCYILCLFYLLMAGTMKTEKRVPLVLEGGCLSQFYRIRILYDGLFTNGLYSPNGGLLLMSYMISGLFIHYGWTYWKIRMWSKLCLPSTLRNMNSILVFVEDS
jgi:hypothetical protein